MIFERHDSGFHETVPDHPVIQNMERYGTPDGKPEPEHICPICGREYTVSYKSKMRHTFNEWVGCDMCVKEEYD